MPPQVIQFEAIYCCVENNLDIAYLILLPVLGESSEALARQYASKILHFISTSKPNSSLVSSRYKAILNNHFFAI